MTPIMVTNTNRRHVVVGAALLRQQSVPDLPGEDRRTLPLVLSDLRDDIVGRDPRFTAADSARTYGSGLVIAAQYLRHTTVRYLAVSG